jgi:ApbE superfamily uncharacterized protein (UPF0280 family)
MIREHFQYRETIATILAEEAVHVAAAREGLRGARREVERCIAGDPFFAITYSPYRPAFRGRVVDRMADAAAEAGVGPMAAVAGAIAWSGAEAMQEAGAAFGVIDNGGDIALFSDREVTVGVHAGGAPLSNRIAFSVPPTGGILGICTSSATVGHSVSLGIADAVTVLCPDVAVADAWATALCNTVTPYDDGAFGPLEGTRVQGVLVIIGDRVAMWGTLPPLVGATVDPDLITRGR